MSSQGTPSVSVVIPVFNHAEELRNCLAAIERQTYGTSDLEVIVVDNGLSTRMRDIVEQFRFARYAVEKQPGSYAARNRGAALSGGDILAFTDADCVPADTWIERGVRSIRALEGAGMIGGRIDLTFLDPQRLTAAELVESVFAFPQEQYISWGFAATANMFTTRETFEQVGPFDDKLKSGGDTEWGQRLRGRGLQQMYAGDVRVTHPARHTLTELLRKTARVAGGHQNLADRRGEGTGEIWRYAWSQLVKLWRIRGNLSHASLRRSSDKLRFSVTVWLVELVRTIERFRVHYGGTSRRS